MSDHILNAAELRTQDSAELDRQLGEFKEELFNLRFQHHTGQLENFMRITHVKRNIARIHTILQERSLAGAAAADETTAAEN